MRANAAGHSHGSSAGVLRGWGRRWGRGRLRAHGAMRPLLSLSLALIYKAPISLKQLLVLYEVCR